MPAGYQGLTPHAALGAANFALGSDEIGDALTHTASPNGDVTATTINEGAAFAADDTTLTVTSGAVFPQDMSTSKFRYIKVNNEIMKVTAVSTNDLTVVRGQFGTPPTAHADGSTVYFWTPHRGWLYCIVTADCIFASGTAMHQGDPPDTSITFTAGKIVPGPFSAIDLTSGSVAAVRF